MNVGSLVLDLARYQVHFEARALTLTPLEFDLLHYLMSHSHRVVPQEELVERVLGGIHGIESSLLRVHISHLRGKLGAASAAIQTVRCRGFWFDGDQLTAALAGANR